MKYNCVVLFLDKYIIYYRPQTKFGARWYFHKRVSRILITGGVCSQRGLLPGVCLVQGGTCSGGVPGGDPPMATTAGGTHPTGMHSCLFIYLFIYAFKIIFSLTTIVEGKMYFLISSKSYEFSELYSGCTLLCYLEMIRQSPSCCWQYSDGFSTWDTISR